MLRSPTPTSPSADDPKSRLLMACIACIEEVGISAVTTRRIAAKAGTNVSAVNYHFGSKEQLLEQSLAYSRNEAFINPISDFDQLVAQGTSQHTALRCVIRTLMRNALQYPRMSFAHFRDVMDNQDFDGVVVEQFNHFLSELDSRLSPLGSDEQKQARRAKLAQIWLVISFNAMAPQLLHRFTGLDLSVDRDLDLYVDQLLVGLFAGE